MCFGGGRDNTAAETQAQLDEREAKRQADIASGKTAIDSNFAQFDDPYYAGYTKSYNDYYTPQIDEQYADARGKLIAALANKGTLESTAGIGQLSKLQKQRDTVATDTANQAQDATNKLRSNVEKSKSDLYSLNEASADPQSLNARAQGEATALVAQPAYSSLGQVFASFLSPLLSSSGSQQYPTYSNPTGYNRSRSGSGMVVG